MFESIEDTQKQYDVESEFLDVPPSMSSFLTTHNNIVLSALRTAFKERVHLTVIRSGSIHVQSSRNTLYKVKKILSGEPLELHHSPEEKSRLTKNKASWQTFTNSLTVEYLCAIYTERDFSKSYILVAPHHNKLVYAKIKDFLTFKEFKAFPEYKRSFKSTPVLVYQPFVDHLEGNEDIEARPEVKNSEKSLPVFVYQPFVEYLKSNGEMAPILKRGKQASPDIPFIKIDASKESLTLLKSRLKMVTSQSCLLNTSQAELFTNSGDEILSNIKSNYQVIGNVFQSDASMNSLVLTHQSDLICIVCPEPDHCPIDNYISLRCNCPDSPTEYKVAKRFPTGDKIWIGETWNLPFNRRLHAELPSMQMDDKIVNFKTALEECFLILDDNKDFGSKITGIHSEVRNFAVLNQFCRDLVAALQSFDQLHLFNSSNRCIAVMVDTPEIQGIMTEILSELIKGKIFFRYDEGMPDNGNVSHGAIPKTSRRSQLETHRDQPVLLVQLTDFSGTPQNLKLAVDTLMRKLTEDKNKYKITDDVRINRKKMENILFFFEEKFIKIVPDIKYQFAKSEGDIFTLVVPENCHVNMQQLFKKALKQILRKEIDVQNIQDKTNLNCTVTQCNHEFPSVKCTYVEKRSQILIESLYLKDLTMVEKKIKSQLGKLPDQEKPNSEELPRYIQANFQSDFESSFLPIRVIHDDILSVDAESIACPVSKMMPQMSYICQLILQEAGAGVRQELMACYDRYPDKILPEGEVIFTPAGDLKYNHIFFVCCPENTYSNDEYNIQQTLGLAMFKMLKKAESHLLKSVAFPVLGSGILNIPLDLCLEAALDGIKAFMNETNNTLKGISFVDNQERNCNLIMNFLEIYRIPFQYNLEGEKPRSEVTEQEQRTRGPLENLLMQSLDYVENLIPSGPQSQIHRQSLDNEEDSHQSLPPGQIHRQSLDHVEDSYQSLPPRQIHRQSLDYEENSHQSLPPRQIYRQSLDSEENSHQSLPPRQIHRQSLDYEENPHRRPSPSEIYRQSMDYEENPNQSLTPSQVDMSIPCPVCFKPLSDPKKFDNCRHEYCSKCISGWLDVIGQMCPLCMNTKPQPPGEMHVRLSSKGLPGFEEFQTFNISYIIPNGIQQKIHPNPGKMYHGTMRKAYLPANDAGECVLKMLQKAFKKHLIFNVGDSLTSKKSDAVIWNGVVHKSKITGGPPEYCYPDPFYLDDVSAQLVVFGITPESVRFEKVEPEIKLTALC